jgi:hypothetical protein
MAQDLTVNIKTTSDVPEAMNKAKTATTGFAKQIQDIGNKFGTSFKDIFLSFLGPMALLTGAIALIGKMIADNEKNRSEAMQAAISDTNELMSAEDRYYAKKLERENKGKEKVKEAETARVEVTKEFLLKDPRRNQVVDEMTFQHLGANRLADRKEIQDKVQAIISKDLENNPEEPAAKEAEKKAGSFKGPEGFGTVVGVGANPVMEKMTRQNEILEEIKIILQEQSLINRGGMVPSPFTEAVPVTLQKIGAV